MTPAPEEGTKVGWRPAPASLPPGQRLYVIGDVHGRADLLERLFARIDSHIDADPPHLFREIFLGDYIDRGPNTRGVLDLLLARQASRPLTALAGNHEAMLLDFLRDPDTWPVWSAAGGRETLASYGVAAPRHPADPGALARQALAALPASHLALLRHLDLISMAGGYAFVHAGIRPGTAIDRQVSDDLLWIREPFLSHERPLERVIVHGHTPTPQPEVLAHRIGIDTGAYASGRLTCLVLEEDRLAFLYS